MKIRVKDESGLNQAILEARRQAVALGFDEIEAAKIGTAVSELARNILKYAGSGHVDIHEVKDDLRVGLEIVVQDRGPGIPDVEKAMGDHYSTSGTLGLGLPGVRRLMDDFEIESAPGDGTRVLIRKWRG